jgi:hypothetical protein
METFDQGFIFRGCMNCHNATAHITNSQCGSNCGNVPGNDFLWSLAVNAYPDATVTGPPPVEALAAKQRRFNPSSAAAFESLNALLRSAKSH